MSICNSIDCFLYGYSKEWVSNFKWGNTQKLLITLCDFLCIYKMYLISVEGYKNVNVHFLTIKTTSEIWVSMKDVWSGIGNKNISDLVLKEIYGIWETKNPTEKQVNEYKMTKREIVKSLII